MMLFEKVIHGCLKLRLSFEVSGIYLNGQKIVFEAMENMGKLVNEVSKTMACK